MPFPLPGSPCVYCVTRRCRPHYLFPGNNARHSPRSTADVKTLPSACFLSESCLLHLNSDLRTVGGAWIIFIPVPYVHFGPPFSWRNKNETELEEEWVMDSGKMRPKLGFFYPDSSLWQCHWVIVWVSPDYQPAAFLSFFFSSITLFMSTMELFSLGIGEV